MNISKINLMFCLTVMAVLLGVPTVSAQNDAITFQCIQSFEAFAYGIQEDFTDADQLDIVWIPQYELPDNDGATEYLGANTLFSRIINGKQEIWLVLGTFPIVYDEPMFGVYHINDDTLRLVPRPMGDETSVSIAFAPMVDNSAAIWSSTTQYTPQGVAVLPGMENPYPSSYASVAIFDESKSEFLSFNDSPHIPFVPNTRQENLPGQLRLDSNGILWLFTETDDIYQFDSISRTFQLTAQLDERRWGRITPTLDGSFLILLGTSDEYSFGEFRPLDEFMFELLPNTGELNSLPTPPILLNTLMPAFVDQDNRAWFSAMAYLADGQWTVVNPNPD